MPFAAGLALFAAVDLSRYEGAAQDHTALALVFSIAIAVTSIPVISRIMLDLGLLQTRFARIVLTVAVIEDIVLYVVLAVAIGLVSTPGTVPFGLAGGLGLEPGTAANDVYHTHRRRRRAGPGAGLRPAGLRPAARARARTWSSSAARSGSSWWSC